MTAKINNDIKYECWTCFKKVPMTQWIHKKGFVTYSLCSPKCYELFHKCMKNGVPTSTTGFPGYGLPHTYVLTIKENKK